MLKRLPIIMLVLVVIIIGVSFVLKSCDTNKAPATVSARYEVRADNRTFYTDSYSQGFDKLGKYISLNGYWTLMGTVWTYIASPPYYLSYRGYKEVVITDRTKN